MNILFCESTITSNKVDEAFLEEYQIAQSLGFNVFLFNIDNLSANNIKRISDLQKIIYRGWMLKPTQYKILYDSLLSKNYQLINNPTEYQNCHYLPDSLKFIENYTPKTIYQKIENEEDINSLIKKSKIFSGKPVIIKDYVKSEKHYWNTACFVDNSNNITKLRDTINNFINIREESLNEGIVIREYIELKNIAIHSKSKMPLSEEYRLFFYNNELLDIYDYWEEGKYNIIKPDTKTFEEIAKNIKSNFFTMDIARIKNGELIIIELGDGQVSEIPKNTDKRMFYQKLLNMVKI